MKHWSEIGGVHVYDTLCLIITHSFVTQLFQYFQEKRTS